MSPALAAHLRVLEDKEFPVRTHAAKQYTGAESDERETPPARPKGFTKLKRTPEVTAECRRLRTAGMNYADIGARVGVSESIAWKACQQK